MDLENVDLFVAEGQINKKHLVEASLSNHFGGEKVDPVCGSGDEESAGLLLHPGEEEGENPALLSAGICGRDAHFDLVEPEYGGGHLFHHPARFDEIEMG